MTSTSRISTFAISALVSAVLGGLGCSSSNPPATTDSSTGGKATVATGGATSVTTGATGGTVTATTATGGTPSTSVGATGGTPATGSTGGSTGAASTGQFSPNCASVPVTAAGVAPAKLGVCAATDTQLCYKTCGPQSIGFKSETCVNAAYVEQSGCSFTPGVDYSCYKIPATPDTTCPTTAPQASTACTVAPCTPCSVNSQYLDSTGAAKAGYCVCPTSTTGTSKWSCASNTAWPCPGGQGC